LFETFDSGGLSWAIDQAMKFYMMSPGIKKRQIHRIMTEAVATFNHQITAQQYINIYEKMLQRPLVCRQCTESPGIDEISNRGEHHKPTMEEAMSDSVQLERYDEQNIIRFPRRKRDVEKHQAKLNRVKQ
jgi:hypothetical protein